MTIRYFLAKGDRGGPAEIIEGLSTSTHQEEDGRYVELATVYMKTYCHACKKTGVVGPAGYRLPSIAENGQAFALSGDINICGCNPAPVFYAQRSMMTVITDEDIARMRAPYAPDQYLPEREYAHEPYDLFFHAKHKQTGKDLCHVRYKITLEDGRQFVGVTDEKGHTLKVSSTAALTAKIEIPYHDHSSTDTASEPEPCGC